MENSPRCKDPIKAPFLGEVTETLSDRVAVKQPCSTTNGDEQTQGSCTAVNVTQGPGLATKAAQEILVCDKTNEEDETAEDLSDATATCDEVVRNQAADGSATFHVTHVSVLESQQVTHAKRPSSASESHADATATEPGFESCDIYVGQQPSNRPPSTVHEPAATTKPALVQAIDQVFNHAVAQSIQNGAVDMDAACILGRSKSGTGEVVEEIYWSKIESSKWGPAGVGIFPKSKSMDCVILGVAGWGGICQAAASKDASQWVSDIPGVEQVLHQSIGAGERGVTRRKTTELSGTFHNCATTKEAGKGEVC